MKIGIAFDLAPEAGGSGTPHAGPDDRFEEFDRPETVDAIADVLRALGHEVALLGDGRAFLARMLADPPDLVWNLAEGEGNGRCREARVPAALEMLGIPHTGSDPLALAAALDKDVARRLVASSGVVVPWGMAFDPSRSADAVALALASDEIAVAFPLILKPNAEGSSKGIRGRCLADSPQQAAATFARLAADYRQPILVEEFIQGDELTVGVLGTGDSARVLGLMRVVPREPDPDFVYSLEVKRDWRSRVSYETPAQLEAATFEKLSRAALAAHRALDCRDVSRVDFRLRKNVPHFIEINPLPGLAPLTSDLVILAEGYGIDHAGLIRLILEAATDRLGMTAGRT